MLVKWSERPAFHLHLFLHVAEQNSHRKVCPKQPQKKLDGLLSGLGGGAFFILRIEHSCENLRKVIQTNSEAIKCGWGKLSNFEDSLILLEILDFPRNFSIFQLSIKQNYTREMKVSLAKRSCILIKSGESLKFIDYSIFLDLTFLILFALSKL